MHPIQTYRLTLWLPLAVTLLFICLLVFYSVNEYQHRLFDIKEASKTQLQETALQLGHSIEYAIANNDSQQARSSVARFTLRADAQLALLLDNNNLIESSTYFIWQNQPAQKVLDEELIQYIELARSTQKIFEYGHDQDGLLTLILPLLEANQGRVLVLQNSIKKQTEKSKNRHYRRNYSIVVTDHIGQFSANCPDSKNGVSSIGCFAKINRTDSGSAV